ncbi:MAG TPA: LapA family protein [Acidimicrobiales bacterium]|jgi:uncharacterized integral membrane protein|nr:LapA family protein [Acidimicrobiales bacterium]
MTDHEAPGKSPRRLDTQQVSTIVAGILLAWFAIANWQRVEIHFWVISAHASLTVVIAVSAVLGGFVTWLARRRAHSRSGD